MSTANQDKLNMPPPQWRPRVAKGGVRHSANLVPTVKQQFVEHLLVDLFGQRHAINCSAQTIENTGGKHTFLQRGEGLQMISHVRLDGFALIPFSQIRTLLHCSIP